MGCTAGGVVVYLKTPKKRTEFTAIDIPWSNYKLKPFS